MRQPSKVVICFLLCCCFGISAARGERPSPLRAMRREAKRVNLMGTTRPTGQGFKGTGQRPSFQQAQAVRGRFINLVGRKLGTETLPGFDGLKPLKISVFQLDGRQVKRFERYMRKGLERIADGRLSGAKLAKFEARVDILAKGFYTKDGKHVSPGCKRIRTLADVASTLSFAVAFLEGNLPPNDLGYIFDQTVSLPRKDEIVHNSVQRARDVVKQNPSLLGSNTKPIFNGILSRLDPNRPTFMGVRVNDKPLPAL